MNLERRRQAGGQSPTNDGFRLHSQLIHHQVVSHWITLRLAVATLVMLITNVLVVDQIPGHQ